MMHGTELHLTHPSGARVVLIGTRHVSSRDGELAAAAVARCQPRTLILEVDEVLEVRIATYCDQ